MGKLINIDNGDTLTDIWVKDCTEGPAIIEEAFWTCKVNPGWTLEFTVNGEARC